MNVRALDAADGRAWHRLLVDGAETCPSAFLMSASEARAMREERIAAVLAEGAQWGVFDGETLVGFLALHRGRLERLRHRAMIGPFYVSARGGGFGQRLFDGVMDHAAEDGIDWIDLWVAATNRGAQRFYARNGFSVVATRPDAVRMDGVSEADILMTRRLEADGQGD